MKRMNWLLLAGTIFLTACSSDAGNVQKDVDSVYTAKEELVLSLNEIQAKETQIQAEFDESIAADTELVSFKDGSASVYANIESRKEQLAKIQNAVKSLQEDVDNLQAFEEADLPLEAITAFANTISEMNTLVTDYVTSYEAQLEQETQTFESFGSEEADFKTLYDGVDVLNTTSDANLDKIQPLVDLLSEIDSQEAALVSDLANLQNK